MERTRSRPPVSRRTFLKLVGGGIFVAGGYAVFEAAPWLDYDQQRERTWRGLDMEMSMSANMQEMVRYATLAANGHNAQPWTFAIQADSVEIYPDYTRRLRVVDPENRELWISLGCALENLLLTARALGYATHVTYPGPRDFIRVQLSPDTPHRTEQFEAIPTRQSTRSDYDGQPVKMAILDQLQALPLEPGVALKVITSQPERETVLDYVVEGNLAQYADKAFVNELIAWLRFNKREALGSNDGLYTRCTGNPEVPRWLGRLFVAATKPGQQAETDARKLRSSSGAIVFTSESDDKAAWVRTGQVYQRVALQLTSQGIKSAFLNQPIEVAPLRSQFQSALDLGMARPQLLIRFGHAHPMPQSLRRPVELVLKSP